MCVYLLFVQVKSADGTYFTLTGRKMWISAGSVCDYVVVSAVTDPKEKYRYVFACHVCV